MKPVCACVCFVFFRCVVMGGREGADEKLLRCTARVKWKAHRSETRRRMQLLGWRNVVGCVGEREQLMKGNRRGRPPKEGDLGLAD